MSKNDKILDIFTQIHGNTDYVASHYNDSIADPLNDIFNAFDNFNMNADCKLDTCPDCDSPMSKASNGVSYVCYTCGMIEDIIGLEIDSGSCEKNATSTDIMSSYNTSDNSAAPVKIIGPNHYAYQKKLISNTSSYKKVQKKNTITQISNCIYQCKNSVPAINIVLEAAEYYHKVQEKHVIKRGDVRRGILAACLYRKCIEHGVVRKPKEISDIIGIPQSKLSDGEKILDDLIAKGIIKPTAKYFKALQEKRTIEYYNEMDSVRSFLNRYFAALKIPIDDEKGPDIINPTRTNYKKFAIRLIYFTYKYRIADNSIPSSKCAGIIYILATKKSELTIKRNEIEKECGISKSTFSRFYQEVNKVIEIDNDKLLKVKKRLIHLFNKFKVPIH